MTAGQWSVVSPMGLWLTKWDAALGVERRTVVPDNTKDLSRGTLAAILSPTQTGLGAQGLRRLQQNRG